MSGTSLGDHIRETRKSLNISLRDLEAMTKISFSHLSKIERGEHIPSKETLESLAASLQLNEYELLILAGYSTEADMKFWEAIFENLDPSWGIDLKRYYKEDGTPDIIRFRNEFVHGQFEDVLSEKISEVFFKTYEHYTQSINKRSEKRFVDEVAAEIDPKYFAWFDLIDELEKKNIKPDDVKRVLLFEDTLVRHLMNDQYFRKRVYDWMYKR